MWTEFVAINLLLLSVTAVAGCAWSPPGYKGPKSDHFDGKEFFNQGNPPEHGFSDFLKWQRTREPGPWTEWTDAKPGPKPPARVGTGGLRVTFVNHSTMLIQLDEMNILTDPIWSERASPVSFTGPRRVRPPGIRFEDLPPIDVVLISHNHYDHMDLPTLKRLHDVHNPRFYVPLGNRHTLAKAKIDQAVELDWWDAVPLSGALDLICVPARHFSIRGTTDARKTLWAGFVIKSAAGSVYFAGDTGFSPHFEQIATRFGNIRLAMLPVGAYLPEWFMSVHHLSPDDALRAHAILKAQTSVAMHFGTFPLGDDGQTEAIDQLEKILPEADLGETEFWVLGFGEGRVVPAVDGHV
jgi:L-ascorbate metabolism protein UlaG (beta-lactamase superfamily)